MSIWRKKFPVLIMKYPLKSNFLFILRFKGWSKCPPLRVQVTLLRCSKKLQINKAPCSYIYLPYNIVFIYVEINTISNPGKAAEKKRQWSLKSIFCLFYEDSRRVKCFPSRRQYQGFIIRCWKILIQLGILQKKK